MPAVVTVVGSTLAGRVLAPVIFAAVMLVKLAPLTAGNEVIVKIPVLFKVALPLTVTAACG